MRFEVTRLLQDDVVACKRRLLLSTILDIIQKPDMTRRWHAGRAFQRLQICTKVTGTKTRGGDEYHQIGVLE